METPGFSVDVKDIAGMSHAAEATLHGPLDAKGVLPFKTRLQPVLDQGVRHLVLQMEEVKYINSTGLAYLITLSETLRDHQGTVALVGLQPKVKIILDTMGVTEFFQLHARRDAAVQDLKSRITSPPSRTTTRRREGSSTKTGRVSPPTQTPPRKKPGVFARFFKRLFGR